jgi:hypothetical protein
LKKIRSKSAGRSIEQATHIVAMFSDWEEIEESEVADWEVLEKR